MTIPFLEHPDPPRWRRAIASAFLGILSVLTAIAGCRRWSR